MDGLEKSVAMYGATYHVTSSLAHMFNLRPMVVVTKLELKVVG